MRTSMELEQKIELLTSLATEDQEGPPGARPLPPRLRHTTDVGILRPLNIRTLRGSGGAGRSGCCAS